MPRIERTDNSHQSRPEDPRYSDTTHLQQQAYNVSHGESSSSRGESSSSRGESSSRNRGHRRLHVPNPFSDRRRRHTERQSTSFEGPSGRGPLTTERVQRLVNQPLPENERQAQRDQLRQTQIGELASLHNMYDLDSRMDPENRQVLWDQYQLDRNTVNIRHGLERENLERSLDAPPIYETNGRPPVYPLDENQTYGLDENQTYGLDGRPTYPPSYYSDRENPGF